MNNSEILKLLAKRNGLTLKETKKLLKQMVGVFSDTLGNYVGFSIPDLGTFGTHIREARQAYDLNRQAHVLLPPKRLVSFSPAVGLKDEIKEIEVEPPAPRPAVNAPKEAAPGAEAPLEVQEDKAEESHESLRRELQAERAAETAEETQDDVTTIPDEAATEGVDQPDAALPEPAKAPEPTSEDEQAREQPPQAGATATETTITEPPEAPQPAGPSDQAAPQQPDSDVPPSGTKNPEAEKRP
ncbi:MAG: HU family DNA-binding protein [Candidatus Marinimicrobia bacterium]|nr:HU family DNA-binding protein [Candidatus Neomarinimicrobiota bacterium]